METAIVKRPHTDAKCKQYLTTCSSTTPQHTEFTSLVSLYVRTMFALKRMHILIVPLYLTVQMSFGGATVEVAVVTAVTSVVAVVVLVLFLLWSTPCDNAIPTSQPPHISLVTISDYKLCATAFTHSTTSSWIKITNASLNSSRTDMYCVLRDPCCIFMGHSLELTILFLQA